MTFPDLEDCKRGYSASADGHSRSGISAITTISPPLQKGLMKMETHPAAAVQKTSLTPKAIINKKFGGEACYTVEEVQEPTENECPGLAIAQKGPCLYRCHLELPEFSVVSETFKKKKDAEQSAAGMALEKLGISPRTYDPIVQDPWDELAKRLSYVFSNEFLSSLHPLGSHLRAVLHRRRELNGSVPISVLAAYDSKLYNLCKVIDPKSEADPLLTIALIKKVVSRLSDFISTSKDQLSVRKGNPYPSDIIQAVVNMELSLPESVQIEAVRIPYSVEKTLEPLIITVASNGYYLDVVAQELGSSDASKILVSRTIGKASSEIRFYFCTPKSCPEQLSSSFLRSPEDPHFKESFNARASCLSGHLIYGDAILASIGYTWKSVGLFYGGVSLTTYHRILINKTPSGIYKLSREAILLAELPGAFTTKSNWRGSFPRDILCTFCRQHHLSEPVFSAVSNHLELLPDSTGSHKRIKVTESGNKEMYGGGDAVSGSKPVGSHETFSFMVKIYSKSQDLIIECSPKESFRKQNDAIQNAALKVLLWLNQCFTKLDMPLDELISSGDIFDILFHPKHFFKELALCISVCTSQQIGTQEGRVINPNCINNLKGLLGDVYIEGACFGASPSNGSLVCIVYTISLVTEGEVMKELIESSEEFEFEVGTGSVNSSIEAVVTQMSVGQSARFYVDLSPEEYILASARDSSRVLRLLTSRGCRLEYFTTLLQVTEPLEDRMEQALFTPPLSKQRVEYALQHIKESCATSLVDFGCGSGSLLESLLEYPTSLDKIVGVDISQKGLTRAAKILHTKLSRSSDITILSTCITSAQLFEGSITVFDSRLFGLDIGTCLEVIEHMEEDQACLFGDIVLSSFCPRILIVSTPNYEYNVILQRSSFQSQDEDVDEKTQSLTCKFRNHDHKFEWTREQFRCWASKLAMKHNYSVEFSGVGGTADVEPGFASQIAVFKRGYKCPKNVDETHRYETIWEWSSTNSSRSVL